MPLDLLPLFPLSVVLFPRVLLRLHIFEDRYRKMIGQAIRDHLEFGIVLAEEKGIAGQGCTAVVEDVTRRYHDGRLDITAKGVRRFEILTLDSEEAFLRGSVSYFNDEESNEPTEELRRRVIQDYDELLRTLGTSPASEPEWDDPQLSFQLGQMVSDLGFRQSLLASRSEVERLGMLVEFFPEHMKRQHHISHVKEVAPTNGRGFKKTAS